MESTFDNIFGENRGRTKKAPEFSDEQLVNILVNEQFTRLFEREMNGDDREPYLWLGNRVAYSEERMFLISEREDGLFSWRLFAGHTNAFGSKPIGKERAFVVLRQGVDENDNWKCLIETMRFQDAVSKYYTDDSEVHYRILREQIIDEVETLSIIEDGSILQISRACLDEEEEANRLAAEQEAKKYAMHLQGKDDNFYPLPKNPHLFINPFRAYCRKEIVRLHSYVVEDQAFIICAAKKYSYRSDSSDYYHFLVITVYEDTDTIHTSELPTLEDTVDFYLWCLRNAGAKVQEHGDTETMWKSGYTSAKWIREHALKWMS